MNKQEEEKEGKEGAHMRVEQAHTQAKELTRERMTQTQEHADERERAKERDR